MLLNKWRETCRRLASVPFQDSAALDEIPAADDLAAFEEAEYRRHVVQQALRTLGGEFPRTTWRAFQEYVLAGRPAEDVAAELGAVSVGTAERLALEHDALLSLAEVADGDTCRNAASEGHVGVVEGVASIGSGVRGGGERLACGFVHSGDLAARSLQFSVVVPDALVEYVARRPFGGERCSTLLSNPGVLPIDQFAGCRVLDALPAPVVLSAPGFMVVSSEHRGQLSVQLLYRRGYLGRGELLERLPQLKRDLLGDSG